MCTLSDMLLFKIDKMKPFILKHCKDGGTIPSVNSIRQLHLFKLFGCHFATVKAKLTNQSVIIIADEITVKTIAFWMWLQGFMGSNFFIILTTPSAWAGYDTRSIFKRSLTGLNSAFSFSLTSCLTKAEEPSQSYYLPIVGGRIIGFLPFPGVLVLCKMQSVSSRIWTCVAVSISYDDNHYTTGTFFYWCCNPDRMQSSNCKSGLHLSSNSRWYYIWVYSCICKKNSKAYCKKSHCEVLSTHTIYCA